MGKAGLGVTAGLLSVVLLLGVGLALTPACQPFTGESAAESADAGGSETGVDGAADTGDAAVGVCSIPLCTTLRPFCYAFSFDTPCGAPDWTLFANVGAVASCDVGKIVLVGDGTQDVRADLEAATPADATTLHLTLRFRINAWDGKRLVGIELGSTVNVIATLEPTGYAISFDETDPPATRKVIVAPETEHVLSLDVRGGSAELRIDCGAPIVLEGAAVVPKNGDVKIKLGHDDAEPIDGTFDDLSLRFE